MKIQRTDFSLMLGFAVLALLLRLPFVSHYLYHWDSVNFALSLEKFDVRLDQPHPPGYILYSYLGRLVNFFVGNANTSLVIVSLIAGILGVVAIYWLGLRMFNRAIAIVAAVFVLTSPLHWFYAEVALSYELEFFFVILVAGLAYLLIQGDHALWPWLALALGVAGGVRQNTLVFLFPLFLLALYFLNWRKRIWSLVLLGGVVLAWLVPMVMLSGGLQGYLSVLRKGGSFVADNSSIFSPLQVLLNSARLTAFIAYALILGNLLFIYGLWLLVKHWREVVRDRRSWVLAVWTLPSMFFYGVLFVRQPGYIFTFLPALMLVAAFLAVRLGNSIAERLRSPASASLVPSAIVVINVLFFLFAPAKLFGRDNIVFLTPSRHTIVARDTSLADRIQTVREQFNPQDTVVLGGSWDFRIPDYYLRDYQMPHLSYQMKAQPTLLPSNVDTVVFLEPIYPNSVLATLPYKTITLSDGETIEYVTWPKGTRAELGTDGLTLMASK